MRLVESLAVLLVAVILAFTGGCVWNKLGARDDKAVAEAQLANANASIEACALTLAAVRDQSAGEIAKADEQMAAAMQAAQSLARENLHLASELGDAETALIRARQEPTCHAQLEAELCAAVPLL